MPTSREYFVTWQDAAGTVWLFGGHAFGVPLSLSDMWFYRATTDEWIWQGGCVQNGGGGGRRGVVVWRVCRMGKGFVE